MAAEGAAAAQRLGSPERLAFATPAGEIAAAPSQDIYLSTIRPDDAARIAGAPLVFVGYGVKATERGWDDFKGADLKGKVAVFLINDPDFAARPVSLPQASSATAR